MEDEAKLQKKIKQVLPHLNEHLKRIYLASEAESIGHGGVSLLSRLSSVSRPTIILGKAELNQTTPTEIRINKERTRKEGGGRKKSTEKDPKILKDLEAMI